jgi:hypothetical protein
MPPRVHRKLASRPLDAGAGSSNDFDNHAADCAHDDPLACTSLRFGIIRSVGAGNPLCRVGWSQFCGRAAGAHVQGF